MYKDTKHHVKYIDKYFLPINITPSQLKLCSNYTDITPYHIDLTDITQSQVEDIIDITQSQVEDITDIYHIKIT